MAATLIRFPVERARPPGGLTNYDDHVIIVARSPEQRRWDEACEAVMQAFKSFDFLFDPKGKP